MKITKPLSLSLAAGALAALGASLVLAGPLEPPGGGVASSGRTTTEIYNAVQTLGASVGGDACGPDIGGEPRPMGQVTLPFGGGAVPVYAVTLDAEAPLVTGGGGAAPRPRINTFSFTRDVAANSPEVHRSVFTAAVVTDPLVLTLFDATNAPFYQVRCDPFVVARVVTQVVQACDGSSRQLETITIFPRRIEIETLGPNGSLVTFDPVNNTVD
ncbi:MAG: hypothetical protein CMJ31_06390 [Phycisphaerae bacterium]|nr:hypothetical protein [Phycisphaerae bacterium]